MEKFKSVLRKTKINQARNSYTELKFILGRFQRSIKRETEMKINFITFVLGYHFLCTLQIRFQNLSNYVNCSQTRACVEHPIVIGQFYLGKINCEPRFIVVVSLVWTLRYGNKF